MHAQDVRIVPSVVTVKIVGTANRAIDVSNAESQDDVRTLLNCCYVTNVIIVMIVLVVRCAQIVTNVEDVAAVITVPSVTIVLDAIILMVAVTILTISNIHQKNTIKS